MRPRPEQTQVELSTTTIQEPPHDGCLYISYGIGEHLGLELVLKVVKAYVGALQSSVLEPHLSSPDIRRDTR
jgi:hypothetical protein